MTASRLALAVSHATKSHRGGVIALDDCSFELAEGRVAALVGSNGAGKTTLLNLVAGVESVTAGSVVTPSQSRVALVGQSQPLYGWFSPTDMLDFGRRTNVVWDRRLAEGWLRAFDVPFDRGCRSLSAGQRTHVALAVALGSRPDLLLLDEPFASLDPVVRVDAAGALLAIAAECGLTVVFSTHVVSELVGIADHLLLLADGRLLLSGDIDDLLAQHTLCVGPRRDSVPFPGDVVLMSHTERQTTAVIRRPVERTAPVAEHIVPAGWTTARIALDDLIVSYLRTVAPADRTARLRELVTAPEAQ